MKKDTALKKIMKLEEGVNADDRKNLPVTHQQQAIKNLYVWLDNKTWGTIMQPIDTAIKALDKEAAPLTAKVNAKEPLELSQQVTYDDLVAAYNIYKSFRSAISNHVRNVELQKADRARYRQS